MKEYGFDPSRRLFIKWGAVATVSTAATLACGGQGRAVVESVDNQADALHLAEEIERQFKIKISLTERPAGEKLDYKIGESEMSINYNPLPVDAQKKHLVDLYKALSSYPKEYFDAIDAGSLTIVIVENLTGTIDGKTVDLQGAHTYNEDGTRNMYIGPRGKTAEMIFYHEGQHRLTPPGSDSYIKIADFFNRANVQFGHKPYPKSQDVLADESLCEAFGAPKGSATCFGATSPTEDAAEIVQKLMMGDKSFWDRLDGDPALEFKTSMMIDIYSNATNGRMNRQFFENIRDGVDNSLGWVAVSQVVRAK